MATILLVNFAGEQGARLAAFLRNERHEVSVAYGNPQFSEMIRQYGTTDLVILDVSFREGSTRNLLGQIVSHRVQAGPRPMLLCVSRVYRGPQFELELERKGARLVYI
jgi:DNA-binding NtrC family response regulator